MCDNTTVILGIFSQPPWSDLTRHSWIVFDPCTTRPPHIALHAFHCQHVVAYSVRHGVSIAPKRTVIHTCGTTESGLSVLHGAVYWWCSVVPCPRSTCSLGHPVRHDRYCRTHYTTRGHAGGLPYVCTHRSFSEPHRQTLTQRLRLTEDKRETDSG